MTIEIDQSGRMEYTSVPTSIGDSQRNNLFLSARDKRTIQSVYRDIGKPRRFVIETFSLMTALVIAQTIDVTNRYIVDLEYPGKDNQIKSHVVRYLLRLGIAIEPEQLIFSRIGKQSKAHESAYLGYTKEKIQKRITAETLMKLLLP